MRVLPPRQVLIQLLGSNDFFLWEYYGEGVLGRILAWIFRSRIKVLVKSLAELRFKPRRVLDAGCGPMFISCVLSGNNEYVGVDIMSADKLKKYRYAMRSLGVKAIEVVRASVESLPFRNGVFDFALSLDVLEHVGKPRSAVTEIYRVIEDGGALGMSLPLENLFQKLSKAVSVRLHVYENYGRPYPE